MTRKKTVEEIKKFPKTSSRKGQFIRHEGGKREMCELVENYAREVAEEAVKKARKETEEEAARSFFKNGAEFDLVYRSIKTLSKEELLSIYKEVQNSKLK